MCEEVDYSRNKYRRELSLTYSLAAAHLPTFEMGYILPKSFVPLYPK